MAKLTRYSSFEELKSSHIVTANHSDDNDKKSSAFEELFKYFRKELLIQETAKNNNEDREK